MPRREPTRAATARFWLSGWLEDPFFMLGFCIHRFGCLFGLHTWQWNEDIRIPFYGWGAWRCLACRAIKVRP